MDAHITAAEFAQRLTERFRWIGENRMSDLPIYHHGLDVEAVGFSAMEDGWFGVLITPWFMNAMLFPLEPESLETLESLVLDGDLDGFMAATLAQDVAGKSRSEAQAAG